MKSFLSCFAVLAILACFLFSWPVNAEAESTMSVRVLNDFEPTTLNETNSRIVSSGAQLNTFEIGGYHGTAGLKMYNDNAGWLEYDIYSYDANGVTSTWRDDWQQAKYVQFYVDNQGPGTAYIAFTSMKKDSGAIDKYQDFYFTESTQFIGSIDGMQWTNLEKQINGNGFYEVVIPADFQGFVRAELNTTNLRLPDTQWGSYDGQIGKLEMSFGVINSTVWIDDIALVGNFTDTIAGVQFLENAYFNLKMAVDMPQNLENISTILDFEDGVADVRSGINYIPMVFSQSSEWSAAGGNSLKLVVSAAAGSSPKITQVQPSNFYADASSAMYLEFSVKNASSIPFGITWCKLNGTSFDAQNAQITIFENGAWYTVDAYDDESFCIPGNYEGKIRVKLGTNGVALGDTLISNFEFAVKETSRTAGATLFLDAFCLVGEHQSVVAYEEIMMPTDLDYVKNVIDFDKINLDTLRSGINYLPITFSLGNEVANSGNALIVTTGTGGGTPNLSQVQPAAFYQNWTGGQYLQIWISNPNAFDFALCWNKINGVSYNANDTEISLQFDDGKWYRAKTGGDADGAIIPAGFTGNLRVKLDDRFGDLVLVENLEFALWCAGDIPNQKIYIDSIVVMGDRDQHNEIEVPNTVMEFPVEDILSRIKDGQKVFEYQITENIPVPIEIINAIKGKDIVFQFTLLSKCGTGLYRWTLIGSELTDVTEFFPVVTLDAAAPNDVMDFKVENGGVSGAYLSLYVRNVFPSFTAIYVYDAAKQTLLYSGDAVSELGWYSLSVPVNGEYLLSNDSLEMEEVSEIRVFQDFAPSTITSANGVFTWENAQSNTFVSGGKDHSIGLRMFNDNNGWAIYTLYGYTGDAVASAWRSDWTGAKYIQFYADNQGKGTADIVLGLMDDYSRYGQEVFWAKSELKIYAMDLATGVWTLWQSGRNADGNYGVTIPAGFKGYIRMEIDLTKMQSEWNNIQLRIDDIGMCRMSANVKNTTLFVDDFALAGNFVSKVDGVQYTVSEYFNAQHNHTPGEAVNENVNGPTCGAAGSHDEVVYCSVCHTELSRETITDPATGEHSWNEGEVTEKPTYTEEGVMTFTCGVCGETRTEVIEVLKETIKHYGQNLRLQDLIKIGYYFYLDTTEGVEEVGALLWTAEQFAEETDFTVTSSNAKLFGNMEGQGGFYIVETDGIYAQNLGDAYVLIPYYKTAEGYTYGVAKEYSALDYAKLALAQTDAAYDDLKSLVVDLLNYATAARAYFCITENLAAPTEPFNSILAEEDRIVNFSDELRVAYPAVDEKGEFAVNYYGRNLNLLSAISIGIYYLEAEDIAGAYYWNEAAYAGNSEHTSVNKSGDTVVKVGEGYKKFSVSGLYAYNIYDAYYVRPYDANGELADTTSVSVAAYLTQAIDAYASSDKVEDQAIVALCQAMLVYGNNARTNSSIERG